MKSFLKKFWIPIGIGIVTIVAISLIIIAFTRTGKSKNNKDDNIYLHIQYETKQDKINMFISANKEANLNLSYSIGQTEKVVDIQVVKVESDAEEKQDSFEATYFFERKEEIYIVKNLFLKYNEKELYSKESITVPSLDSDDNQDTSLISKDITGKLIEDNLETIHLNFYKDSEILSYYNYIVECDGNEIQKDSITFQNGNLAIFKNLFKVGDHELYVLVSQGSDVGEFSYSFTVSNEVFIKNPTLEVVGEYYEGVKQVELNLSIDATEDIVDSLVLNGETYSEIEYNIDDVNSKITYIVNVELNPNSKNSIVTLEKISHKYGDYNLTITKELQFKKISFETKIEYSNEVFFEGDAKQIEVVIGNPEKVLVKQIVFNDKEYECESNEEIIRLYIESTADICTDKLTEIKYNIYDSDFSEAVLTENSTIVLPKVTKWNYNEFVMIGNPVMLSITLNKDITDAAVSFSGWVNLEEFDSETVPFTIEKNIINMDFSDFASSTKDLSITFSGINIAYGNSSYIIAVEDKTHLYYSDLVYNVFNFIYYENEYKLTFNAQTFNNTIIKNLSYKLYDENNNLIKDVTEPSEVYSEESFGYITYYILSIPSEAHYIEVVSLDCVTDNEEVIQITQWLLKNQKQKIKVLTDSN